jgi:serine/threonine protein phosphatase PrpC
MSRSFGDEIAGDVGVIAEPEVQEYSLSENDKFLILATDGIWEFINSQEVSFEI